MRIPGTGIGRMNNWLSRKARKHSPPIRGSCSRPPRGHQQPPVSTSPKPSPPSKNSRPSPRAATTSGFTSNRTASPTIRSWWVSATGSSRCRSRRTTRAAMPGRSRSIPCVQRSRRRRKTGSCAARSRWPSTGFRSSIRSTTGVKMRSRSANSTITAATAGGPTTTTTTWRPCTSRRSLARGCRSPMRSTAIPCMARPNPTARR